MTGLCECGCGLPTPIATRTDSRVNATRGKPRRFRAGHNTRLPAERGYVVDPATGCWVWQRAIDSTTGYGRLQRDGRHHVAHRYLYELLVGPVPDGLELDHLCRNRACVNPAHLEPVTRRENVRRGIGPSAINATKTHCEHGHEFSPENTYVDAMGKRKCRLCGRQWSRDYRIRKAQITELTA